MQGQVRPDSQKASVLAVFGRALFATHMTNGPKVGCKPVRCAIDPIVPVSVTREAVEPITNNLVSEVGAKSDFGSVANVGVGA